MSTRAARVRRLSIPALLLALTAPVPAAAWRPSDEVRELLNVEKRRDPSIPGQAAALIRLAWSEDGTRSPLVRAAARQELAGFGKHALRPIRERFGEIPPRYQADAVETFIEAKYHAGSSLPSDFVAGLDEFVWFGTREARRIALVELGRYPYPPAVLTMIDAVHDDPALLLPTLRTLTALRDDRSTIFLGKVLHEPDPELALAAARAMGRIGGRARSHLREIVAAAADSPAALRRAAVEGLLVEPGADDLSALHEFVADHLDAANDELVDRARLAAAELELRRERAGDDDGF